MGSTGALRIEFDSVIYKVCDAASAGTGAGAWPAHKDAKGVKIARGVEPHPTRGMLGQGHKGVCLFAFFRRTFHSPNSRARFCCLQKEPPCMEFVGRL